MSDGGPNGGEAERQPPGRGCPPVRAVVTLVCCVLFQLTLGVSYTSANLSPYLTSYLRNATGDASIDYTVTLWVDTSGFVFSSCVMPFMGLVERRVPNRLFLFVGCVCFTSAFVGTYWGMQKSFIATVLAYGPLQGLAQAIIYPAAIKLSLSWFPGNKGLVSGVTMAGFGGGAFVWNQIVTNWINPHNLQPDETDGDNLYFTQSQVLSRVPSCYLVLAGILGGLQLLCVLFISYPPPSIHPDTDIKAASDVGTTNVLEITRSEDGDCTAVDGGDDGENKKKDSSVTSSVAVDDDKRKRDSSLSFHMAVISDVHVKDSSLTFGAAVSDGDGDTNEMESSLTCDSTFGSDSRDKEGDLTTTFDNPACSDIPEVAHGGSLDSEQQTNKQGSTDVENPSDAAAAAAISDEERANQMTARDILTSRITWTIIAFNLLLDMGFYYIRSFNKAYGQTFIHDDHLLSFVASGAAVFNAAGRPVWGFVADRAGTLPTLLVCATLLSCLVSTFLLCELVGGAAMFFVWMCLMYFAASGIFSVLNPVIFNLFGAKNFYMAIGIIYFESAMMAPAMIYMSSAMQHAFGWRGIFIFAAVSVFLSVQVMASLLKDFGHPLSPRMKRALFARRKP